MGRHPATKPIELSYLHFPFIPMRCSCYTIPFIKRYRCLSSLCVLTRARRLYIYRLRSNMAFEVVFFRRSLWASRSWIIVVLAFVLPFEFIRIGSPVSKKNTSCNRHIDQIFTFFTPFNPTPCSPNLSFPKFMYFDKCS